MTSQGWKRAGSALAIAASYFIAGKLGLQLAFVHSSATAVWPPTGIGLAACLVLGTRIWPGIFLGAFLTNVTIEGAWATSLGIAAGNTLESLAGAFLVTRWAGGRKAFDRPIDVLRFAFAAALLATTLSATVGVTSLCLAHSASWERFGSIWLTWWLGDASGALIVAPLLMLWSGPCRLAWTRGAWIEIGIVLGILFGVTAAIFGGFLKLEPLAFLCIPVVVWVAVRFEPREAATAMVILCAVALWGTLRGGGPFGGKAPNESLILLQAFMGVVSVTALVLAAAVNERRTAQEALRRARADLEVRVGERTRSLSEAVEALQSEAAQRRRAEEDRSRMMTQLLQGQKLQAVGQLAAGIAHEINNPVGWTLTNLTVVAEHLTELEQVFLGLDRAAQQIAAGGDPAQVVRELDQLKQKLGPKAVLDDCREAIKDCKAGADRIRDIVRNLREFSHIDEGELKVVAVRELLERSLQMCANELKYKATLHREYGEVPPVRCYPQQIEQVLVNLLVNAAQALPERGDIHLRTRTDRDRVAIQIRDNGCGLTPDQKDRLFEPFFTTKPVGKGTGLGLHVAYKIILAHQGSIEVTSEVGKGTEFTILLPAEGPGSPPATAS